MTRILHVLVTCCLEPSRLHVLKAVVNSLQSIPRDDIIVFDNASTQPECHPLLTDNFNCVVSAESNHGLWSAVNWSLKNGPQLLNHNYDMVYVIESDMVHYDYPGLVEAQEFLKLNSDVGSVRLQEFEVANRHLYDKSYPLPNSRRWAWTRLNNHFTGEKAYFDHAGGRMWRTNLAPQIPALNRMEFMQAAFDSLARLDHLSEADFQKEYFKIYTQTALIDGGVFETRLSYESDAITGSYTQPEQLKKVGYRMTRFDRVDPIDSMTVNLQGKTL